jgi:hypothetical protein
MPKLLSHIFNSESKSVTFAWFALTIPAHLFFFFRPDHFKVEHWMAAQGMATALVAGKSWKEGVIESAEIKAAPAAAPAPVAP